MICHNLRDEKKGKEGRKRTKFFPIVDGPRSPPAEILREQLHRKEGQSG